MPEQDFREPSSHRQAGACVKSGSFCGLLSEPVRPPMTNVDGAQIGIVPACPLDGVRLDRQCCPPLGPFVPPTFDDLAARVPTILPTVVPHARLARCSAPTFVALGRITPTLGRRFEVVGARLDRCQRQPSEEHAHAQTVGRNPSVVNLWAHRHRLPPLREPAPTRRNVPLHALPCTLTGHRSISCGDSISWPSEHRYVYVIVRPNGPAMPVRP